MKNIIVLDAMGSDNRPLPEVEGAIEACSSLDIDLLLCGDENTLKSLLDSQSGNKSHIHIVHASQALDMSDHIQEARSKRDNSMAVGMKEVKEGRAQAFVSAGNTGMAMYFGIRTFGLVPGIARPCLCATFPVKDGRCVVADIGANAECRPEFLPQFGQMAALYSELMLGKGPSRIGLLANGEEEGKGNELVKAASPLMRKLPGFVGNIEGKELFAGAVDVAVTDGFTGNILLKSVEAVAKLILSTLKDELMQSTRTKLGAALAKPAFTQVKAMLDPSSIGAVPLLGLDGLVLIGHGRSDSKAIVSAISEANKAIQAGLLPSLRQSFTPQA